MVAISVLDKEVAVAGKGTSGIVYIYKSRSNHLYAIKQYEPFEKSESFSEYKKKSKNEYDILNELHHINIVRSYDFRVPWWNGKTSLYLEYCGRYTLKTILRENDIPIPERLCFIRQIYNAVNYLHSNGVSHRDLKFDNVMIGGSGHIKLIDFQDSRNVKVCYGIVGTTSYVAPEVFSKLEYVGSQADVWSMGIMIYYLLLQKFPWKVAKVEDNGFISYRSSGKLPGVPQLPKQTHQLLTSCLDCDPDSRPTAGSLAENQWLATIEHCNYQTTCKYNHKRLYVP